LTAEIAWRGTWRDSNVAAFEYQRQVVGLYLRASSE